MKAAELLRFGFALVVGWTDPEGRRPYLGSLLLAYYDPDGRLVYAGRAGTGINTTELERLWRRLQPLATDTLPLHVPPPRTSGLFRSEQRTVSETQTTITDQLPSQGEKPLDRGKPHTSRVRT